MRAVAGGPGDFEGGAVIKVSGNRPADDGHGAQRAGLVGGADGEDLTCGRRVVTVPGVHEVLRLT
ncbi:hypothetical protein O3Q52_10380 [Streptomyces sp. ActVer]|nr:hypothetical protein [Streptomyces sp. ActVer]MCZ4508606.1 hypothetical protein [Streptomyces sp. ActVer]